MPVPAARGMRIRVGVEGRWASEGTRGQGRDGQVPGRPAPRYVRSSLAAAGVEGPYGESPMEC